MSKRLYKMIRYIAAHESHVAHIDGRGIWVTSRYTQDGVAIEVVDVVQADWTSIRNYLGY